MSLFTNIGHQSFIWDNKLFFFNKQLVGDSVKVISVKQHGKNNNSPRNGGTLRGNVGKSDNLPSWRNSGNKRYTIQTLAKQFDHLRFPRNQVFPEILDDTPNSDCVTFINIPVSLSC